MAEASTGTDAARPKIHAGFIPLIDCAPLVIAAERGLDAEFGFELKLYREVSWANVRDKMEVGTYDCAHMLAPMPLAAALGLGRTSAAIIAPMALNLNGDAITVATRLYEEMSAADAQATKAGGAAAVRALKRVIDARLSAGLAPLTFGMVFPFSSHNYDLRDWLASGGIDPDHDVNLVVIPPSLMDASLRTGRIDGFCAGAPWNSVAVARGDGVIVATKSELLPRSPEKVLGVRAAWSERNPQLMEALIKALIRAGQWLDDPANHQEAAAILAKPEWVGADAGIIASVLSGRLERGGGQTDLSDPELMLFYGHEAQLPRRSHAMWMLSQMIRWGHAHEPFDLGAVADKVYRPDCYRQAAAVLGITLPADEGAGASGSSMDAASRHGFPGAADFGAPQALAYLQGLAIRSPSVDLERFLSLNSVQ